MQTIRAIGIPWYREEDWETIKRIMTDTHKLHSCFEEWLQAAEGLEKNIEGSGQIVERAYIDPEEFPSWCAIRGLNLDAEARSRFANEIVAKKHGHSN